MATIIFDFDDTLFKTQELKKTIFNKMESIGLQLELIKKTYDISKEKYNHYTTNNHISTINEINDLKISKEQAELINNLSFNNYSTKEIHEVLSKLSQNNYLILLTVGDEFYQRIKIGSSGIAKYFNEIHIIPGNKENFLSSNKFQGDVYFINDKKSENEKIKKLFNDIKVIDLNINKRSLRRLLLGVLL